MGGDVQDMDCVVFTAAAFRAHICYWIGDVRDALGVCKEDSLESVLFLDLCRSGRTFTRRRRCSEVEAIGRGG
jgi:hypothetical protein